MLMASYVIHPYRKTSRQRFDRRQPWADTMHPATPPRSSGNPREPASIGLRRTI